VFENDFVEEIDNDLLNDEFDDDVSPNHNLSEIEDDPHDQVETEQSYKSESIVNNIPLSGEQTKEKASVLREKIRRNARKAYSKMNVCIAPAGYGKFKNSKQDIYLEEKCLPHLFPYGVGGFLSTCVSTKVNSRFAAYCHHCVFKCKPAMTMFTLRSYFW
jgi:hypothetical protein